MQHLSIKLSRISILSILLAVAVLPAFSVTTPQQPAEPAPVQSVIDKIMEESEGNIQILIDPDLMQNIMEAPHGAVKQKTTVKKTTTPKMKAGKMPGFRIQVFSDGRNQNSLEARAKARGNAIAARFPKYRGQVYTYSSAPNWITRVGNFPTAAEANAALSELKRSFPNFAGEMRVVKAEIYVIR